MKYWKGKTGTNKDGQYGTMSDNGNVPDSEPTTKAEYDNYINLNIKPIVKSLLQIDIENVITITDIKIILERIRKGEK